MRRERISSANERQLVGRVLRGLGLSAASECDRFFQYFHSVANLRYASQQQCDRYVRGRRERRALLTAIDLGRWAQRAPRQIYGEVVASSQIGESLMDDLRYAPQECLEVLALDTKHQVIDRQTVFVGTLDNCPVHPREIFRLAILTGAAAIVVAHNHPSGLADPSPNDLTFMRRLAECGQLMGIPVLDGFVIGLRTYFSLREAGILPLIQKTNKSEGLKSD
ncbi:JAB domain-containing protein [Levilactobacillus fuyuanensis]|uniref:RadC family protein n=1 Tax=Levilactobacillus fuyuanensis TaxID=2486022 RepID=A0ABW4H0M7_9LACO|nr:JAB domain-containing protein [Levilactobacillus fuyuanensis]